MKKLFLLLLFAGTASCATKAQSENKSPVEKTKVPDLIELFTSEGCSSCPPAEALLQQMQEENKDLIVLSYHVDYWDRLGWKDPFSQPAWTRRQNEYANAFHSENVYTPQAVVNGSGHVTGSSRTGVKALLEKHSLSPKSTSIEIQVTAGSGQCRVVYKAPLTGGKVLQLVLVQKEATTKVKRGENGGKTLRHTNIVLEATQVNTAAGEVLFSLPAGAVNSNYAVVAFVQQRDNMHIVSVAKKDF